MCDENLLADTDRGAGSLASRWKFRFTHAEGYDLLPLS
jgi:hypothetical protein